MHYPLKSFRVDRTTFMLSIMISNRQQERSMKTDYMVIITVMH